MKLSDNYPEYQVTANLDVLTAKEALGAAGVFDQNQGNGCHARAEWARTYGQRCLEEIVHLRAYPSSTSAGVTEEQTPRVTEALRCLEELANMPLGISLEDWGRLSSPILAALEASRSPVSQKEAVPVDCSRENTSEGLASRLIERMKLRYLSNCKCGNCHLVPLDLISEAASFVCDPAPAPAGEPGIKALDEIAEEARRYAGFYPEASDGRNTFIIFAEWVERRSAPHPSPTPVSAPVGVVELHIVFQDDGGAANLRFVEVETLDRKSVCAGTWLKRDDGYDVLALSVHPSDIKTVEAK